MFLCRGKPAGSTGAASDVQAWALLLTVLLAEHFYLAAQMAVRAMMGKIDNPGLQRERKERFAMRKQMLGDGGVGIGEGVQEKLGESGLQGEAGSGDQETPDGR